MPFDGTASRLFWTAARLCMLDVLSGTRHSQHLREHPVLKSIHPSGRHFGALGNQSLIDPV